MRISMHTRKRRKDVYHRGGLFLLAVYDKRISLFNVTAGAFFLPLGVMAIGLAMNGLF